MWRTRLPGPVGFTASQLRAGRTTSALIRVRSEEPSARSRQSAVMPLSRSQAAGLPRHAVPAASDPLASQRSCHVVPGCSSSQSSRNASPRRRIFSV